MIGEYGHQPLCFTKGRTLLEYLNDYYLLTKNAAPLSLFLGLFNNAFSSAQIKRTEWEDDSKNELESKCKEMVKNYFKMLDQNSLRGTGETP
jgi:hypothetical protein